MASLDAKLMQAVSTGDAEQTRRLLVEPKSPNIETRNNQGSTPVLKAAAAGHMEVLAQLCQAGANKEATDSKGRTPLMRASAEGRLEIVRYLLAMRVEKETRDQSGKTAIDMAREEGYDEIVKLIDGSRPALEGWMSKDRLSPPKPRVPTPRRGELFKAIRKKDEGQACDLISAGAKLEETDDLGYTPLMCAAGSALASTVAALLQAGADIDVMNDEGWSVLSIAAFSGSAEVVKLLLDAGADKTSKTNDGKLPLDLARREGYDEVIKLLE